MLKTELCSIQFAEVDWSDTTCLVTYGARPEKLFLSIQAVGLLQNPLLQRKKNGLLRIICGSRRLSVCRELGLEPLPCQVLPSCLPVETCLRVAIYDNTSHRALNPVEKSLALTRMARCLPESEIIAEFMPLLDLEPSVKLYSRQRKLTELEPVILDALAVGSVHERTAFALTRLQSGDRLVLFQLFAELPFSASVQEELVDTVVDIATREGISPAEVIKGGQVRELRATSRRPARQRAQDIRKYLQARRAPRLTGRRERFIREVRELGLPGGVRLAPPPYFEGPQWRLECDFQGTAQLAAQLRQVVRLVDQPEFQRILEST